MGKTSAVSGFYKLSAAERLGIVAEFANLNEVERKAVEGAAGLSLAAADRMSENVVGVFGLPLAFASNFLIDGKEYFVPMAIEEPSVVAAASNGARLARPGGFATSASEPVMRGQVQLVCNDASGAVRELEKKRKEIEKVAKENAKGIEQFGGGVRGIEFGKLKTSRGTVATAIIFVDCRDAMGANTVNTICEAVGAEMEQVAGGKARLRIISNLATERTVRAKCAWKKEAVGEEEIEGILDAYAFAAADVYRACTHNKGIMNGIDAVAVATGNDWRAVEAGAHAYASLSGKYMPLTKYEKMKNGDLLGSIELPIAVGLVGGATKTHPAARACVKVLGVKTASELARVMAAVGLAQNFAALRALSGEGIQKGHMRLHAKNLAVMAGANEGEIGKVANRMEGSGEATLEGAKKALLEIRGEK
jgi:hydroxymethylglutaryl-CoA reductase